MLGATGEPKQATAENSYSRVRFNIPELDMAIAGHITQRCWFHNVIGYQKALSSLYLVILMRREMLMILFYGQS